MKSICEQHCNGTWIDFQLNWIELNWIIGLKFKKTGCKLVEKVFKIL